jgi:ERCC4-type nuclease
MLLVDERIGSKDLLKPLQMAGVAADLAHLEYGDFAFVGRGLNDQDIFIGIELKETKDLIASLRSGRFAGHQLPGLVQTYDRAWLLTEGIWRATPDGVLELMQGGWRTVSVGRHPIMASDLESWLLTQIVRGGVNYWHSPTRRDTIRFIATLYRWWTAKELSEHRGHEAIYLPSPDRATFIEPSTERKMLACIPKVGWDKSGALEQHFGGSVRRVLAATSDELTQVPGIGKTIANTIAAIQ